MISLLNLTMLHYAMLDDKHKHQTLRLHDNPLCHLEQQLHIQPINR